MSNDAHGHSERDGVKGTETSTDTLSTTLPRAHTSTNAQSLQLSAQRLTDQALQFLSTASNETLGACLVGLGATTYFLLGRVGLVLIGVAGGVVLHATWEGASSTADEEGKARDEKRRKETGLEVVHRVLGQRAQLVTSGGTTDGVESGVDVEIHSGEALNFSDFPPEVRKALDEFTDAVIRDYVKCASLIAS